MLWKQQLYVTTFQPSLSHKCDRKAIWPLEKDSKFTLSLDSFCQTTISKVKKELSGLNLSQFESRLGVCITKTMLTEWHEHMQIYWRSLCVSHNNTHRSGSPEKPDSAKLKIIHQLRLCQT